MVLCCFWRDSYRPAKVHDGVAHPDPIVETMSLASVIPPEATYEHRLQVATIRDAAFKAQSGQQKNKQSHARSVRPLQILRNSFAHVSCKVSAGAAASAVVMRLPGFVCVRISTCVMVMKVAALDVQLTSFASHPSAFDSLAFRHILRACKPLGSMRIISGCKMRPCRRLGTLFDLLKTLPTSGRPSKFSLRFQM